MSLSTFGGDIHIFHRVIHRKWVKIPVAAGSFPHLSVCPVRTSDTHCILVDITRHVCFQKIIFAIFLSYFVVLNFPCRQRVERAWRNVPCAQLEKPLRCNHGGIVTAQRKGRQIEGQVQLLCRLKGPAPQHGVGLTRRRQHQGGRLHLTAASSRRPVRAWATLSMSEAAKSALQKSCPFCCALCRKLTAAVLRPEKLKSSGAPRTSALGKATVPALPVWARASMATPPG